MSMTAGTKLGRYEIRSQLGAGGMGEVYLAQDSKLDRKVALKILPAEVAAHPEGMKRFVQEAKTASALPNIPLGAVDATGCSYLFSILTQPRLHSFTIYDLLFTTCDTDNSAARAGR